MINKISKIKSKLFFKALKEKVCILYRMFFVFIQNGKSESFKVSIY